MIPWKDVDEDQSPLQISYWRNEAFAGHNIGHCLIAQPPTPTLAGWRASLGGPPGSVLSSERVECIRGDLRAASHVERVLARITHRIPKHALRMLSEGPWVVFRYAFHRHCQSHNGSSYVYAARACRWGLTTADELLRGRCNVCLSSLLTLLRPSLLPRCTYCSGR